jgi:hypothetical protein
VDTLKVGDIKGGAFSFSVILIFFAIKSGQIHVKKKPFKEYLGVYSFIQVCRLPRGEATYIYGQRNILESPNELNSSVGWVYVTNMRFVTSSFILALPISAKIYNAKNIPTQQ